MLALHELLCFWRAYPDDRALLAQVEAMLAAFGARRDLRRHRAALQDSGVAGTEIRYLFFAQMAQWVAQRWGARLRIDWDEVGDGESLEKILPLLALYSETPGLDEFGFPTREWLDRLARPRNHRRRLPGAPHRRARPGPRRCASTSTSTCRCP